MILEFYLRIIINLTITVKQLNAMQIIWKLAAKFLPWFSFRSHLNSKLTEMLLFCDRKVTSSIRGNSLFAK